MDSITKCYGLCLLSGKGSAPMESDHRTANGNKLLTGLTHFDIVIKAQRQTYFSAVLNQSDMLLILQHGGDYPTLSNPVPQPGIRMAKPT